MGASRKGKGPKQREREREREREKLRGQRRELESKRSWERVERLI